MKRFPLRHAAALLLLAAGHARGDVRLPAIFGDHMVLQREAKIPVWGWAAPGEKVTVTLGTATASATAAADGRWRADLPPTAASSQPQILTVAGTNRLTFQDVLVGDVWLASGQSNMEMGLSVDTRGADAARTANDPGLRVFFVPVGTALEPQSAFKETPAGSLNGHWQVCTPALMANANWGGWKGFSAVAYYFAHDLRQAIRVPVGIIGAYRGSSRSQNWTSIDGLAKDPSSARFVTEHRALVDAFPASSAAFPAKQAEYESAVKSQVAEITADQAALKQWNADADAARAAGRTPPPKPTPTAHLPPAPKPPDGGPFVPATLYNSMIAPLVPYAIKGVVWYQGESNADTVDDAVEYGTLFPRLIADWREKWRQGDLPFLYVQLPGYRKPAATPSEGAWPWAREVQAKSLKIPNTGMATAIDLGDPNDIHPKDKFDVGARLALVARRVVYGQKVVSSGPVFASSKVEGNKIRLIFTETGGGLVIGAPPWSPNGPVPAPAAKLSGFGVAGNDRRFVWADAVIEGNSVLVSSAQVAQPAAVRYDWGDYPAGNLYNKEGLPALPFRTDDWPAPVKMPGR